MLWNAVHYVKYLVTSAMRSDRHGHWADAHATNSLLFVVKCFWCLLCACGDLQLSLVVNSTHD